MCEQNVGLKFCLLRGGCTDVCIFSNWSPQTSPCMCSTNLLSYTRRRHTHSGKPNEKRLKIFAGNEKLWILTHSKLFICYKIQQFCCTRWNSLTSTFLQNVYTSLVWDLLEKCIWFSSQQNDKLMSKCMRGSEQLHRLLRFTNLLS